jgi:lauroyl/myristoyl acyltransferase
MTSEVSHPEPKAGATARKGVVALLKRAPRRALAHASDLTRVLAFLVLRPAAYLPRAWAFGAADTIGYLYSLSAMGARVRKSVRIAFPSRNAPALARELMTRPFRDFVSMSRLIAKREDVNSRPIESRRTPSILNEPGQSLIVATGHFSREPMECLYTHSAISKKLATVVAALDRHSIRPRALRLRLQFGMMVDAIDVVRGGDVEIMHVGRPGLVTKLVKHLKKPDAAVIISSDAVLAKGRETGLHRAFAGHPKVDFALGTARLSRLSQRPIVVCVPFLDDAGRTILEWSDPIAAPARDDESADARITGAVMDILEQAVGVRPGQYVLPIGDQRRWSETSKCWVELDDTMEAPVVPEARTDKSHSSEPALLGPTTIQSD